MDVLSFFGIVYLGARMPLNFKQLVETHALSPQDISESSRIIYETVLHQSSYLDAGNFTRVHPNDLRNLFDLYDQRFFAGGMRSLLDAATISFRFSRRMTQSGGKATRRITRDRAGNPIRTEYEIAVSTALLFETFREDLRPIAVSGLPCRDRLEALQRIFEHEIIHLIEGLLWELSSCAAPRFQSIANRFFGHTDHRHQLITPRETAFRKYGIKPGDQVSFQFEGQNYVGIVNRITKRATILVEDSGGEWYTNGKRYEKFYIPVESLERVEA